jgi:hypothetical protein
LFGVAGWRAPFVLATWSSARVGPDHFTVCDHHGATVARMRRIVAPAEALSEMEVPPRR